MKKNKNIDFNYLEEFITNTKKTTSDDLKKIFNQKYFKYIKRIENKKMEYKA